MKCEGGAMCEKCVEADSRIARLKNMARAILDKQTLDAINGLVGQLEAEKVALHPERNR